MHFAPLGDRALLITLGYSIDDPTHRRVQAALARLDRAEIPGITEFVPAFASIAVHYDPAAWAEGSTTPPYTHVVSALERALDHLGDGEPAPSRLVEIPVCYGGELGPDLDDVAARHGLSADEVVTLHASVDYRVHMVGFMPGFAYLGGLPQAIATPRRDTPRTAVPAGSVGIGGAQTGVYPLVSPGGWHLIGRTPLRLFDVSRDPAALLAAGDRVRFRRISAADFQASES
jgi:inhibitor of KinA